MYRGGNFVCLILRHILDLKLILGCQTVCSILMVSETLAISPAFLEFIQGGRAYFLVHAERVTRLFIDITTIRHTPMLSVISVELLEFQSWQQNVYACVLL